MSIDFGGILRRAWSITWNKKILWVFGFFAMLGAGGGNSGSSGSSGNNFSSGQQNFEGMTRNPSTMPPQMRAIYEAIQSVDWNAILAVILVAVCCLVILGIALQFVSVIGRGGLIAGIRKADAEEALSFGELWQAGMKSFLPFFVFRLIKFAGGIIVGLLSCVIAIPLALCTLGLGLIPWCLAMIVFGVLFEYWFYLMDIAVIAEGQDITGALGRAWQILKANAGPLLIFWLILLAISIGVGLVVLLAMAPGIVMLVAGLWPLIAETGGDINLLLLIPGVLWMLLMTLAAWLVGAVYTTYEVSVHTLAYKEFAKRVPLEPALSASVPAPVA